MKTHVLAWIQTKTLNIKALSLKQSAWSLIHLRTNRVTRIKHASEILRCSQQAVTTAPPPPAIKILRTLQLGEGGGTVETCYKPDGSGIDSHQVTGFFNGLNPFNRTMALGMISSLTEMSTKNLHGFNGRLGREAEKLTALCEPSV
jgi:hypothetical protein